LVNLDFRKKLALKNQQLLQKLETLTESHEIASTQSERGILRKFSFLDWSRASTEATISESAKSMSEGQ